MRHIYKPIAKTYRSITNQLRQSLFGQWLRARWWHRALAALIAGVLLTVLAWGLFVPPKAKATTVPFTTSGTWTVPAGVSSAVFEAWGAGGAGGASSVGSSGGGGGAGGQYAKITLASVNVNDQYTVTVATATAGGSGNGSVGGDSSVADPGTTTVLVAKGGAGGTQNSGAGGTGSTSGGVGDLIYAGGSGATGGASSGGGGGGAGSTGAGGSASGATAGTGTSANGGNGGAGVSVKSAGNNGNNYGGGGSGGLKTSGATQNGGGGAQGYVTVTYTVVNYAPASPTLTSPADVSTGVSLAPQFQLKTTDANSDYINYEIQVCSTSNCSSVLRTVCQVSDAATSCTGSQTGWSGMDANTSTAYVGSSTLAGSTLATYTYQSPNLSPNTQYWWRAYAIDPGGSNTYGSVSTIQSFTTNASPVAPTLTTPASGATAVSVTPQFILSTTDADSDTIKYRIYLYQSNCTTAISGSPFEQATVSTGWDNGSTAYASGVSATYTYQSTLSYSTTYCWKADAIDPTGTGIYGPTSATSLFTTVAAPVINETHINGGTTIRGGTSITH